MSVGAALSKSLETVSDHPSLAIYAGLTGIILSLSGNAEPLVGTTEGGLLLSLLLLVLTPFLMGGLVGLVSATRDGATPTFDQFKAAGVDNYVPLVLMALIVVIGAFAISLVAVIVLLIPLVNIIALLFLVPFFLGLGLVLQFIDVSIIIGDSGPFSAFRDSYELVRENLTSVIGYVLVRWVIGFVAALPMLGLMLGVDLNDPTALEAVMATPEMMGAVLFSGVIGGLLYIFHTVYYRSLVGLEH